MKPKHTLRALLGITSASLLTITYASAADLYWDSDNTTPGFGTGFDPLPGTAAGTWSSSTPSTATGGFTTDPTGSTSIDGSLETPPAVVTTTQSDKVSFGFIL